MLELLKSRLGRYRLLLVAVVVFQAIQSIAGLFLPTINANIINQGIARGDNAYIRRMGLIMILVSFGQIVFSVSAVRAGSRAAMGFGRDARAALFRRVNEYSAREVNRFSAE